MEISELMNKMRNNKCGIIDNEIYNNNNIYIENEFNIKNVTTKSTNRTRKER
jgi:hypothetical protein